MRLDSLTSLRFTAALGVVLCHGTARFTPHSLLRDVWQYGYVGVGFFFVLSGFVLAWTRREDDTPRRFYRRRFARVYPMHALTLLVALALLAPRDLVFRPASWLVSLLLAQSWLPFISQAGTNEVSWTLCCEAFFYACFPFVIGRLAGLDRRRWMVALSLAGLWIISGPVALRVLTDQPEWVLMSNPVYRGGEFMLGILLCLGVQRQWLAPRFGVLPGSVAAAAVLVALALAPGTVAADIANAAMIPAVTLLIVGAARSDLSGRRGLLTRRSLVCLGKWSFALYMTHALLLYAREAWFPGRGSGVVALAVFVAAAVAASAAAYRWCEFPLERNLRGAARR